MVLVPFAGGLGGDEDASGGTLGVTGVGADIVHEGHLVFLVHGVIGEVLKVAQRRVSRLCFSLTRSEELEANDPSALDEVLGGLEATVGTGEVIRIALLAEVEVAELGATFVGVEEGLEGLSDLGLGGGKEHVVEARVHCRIS